MKQRALALSVCVVLMAGFAEAVTLSAFTTTGPSDANCNPGTRASAFLTTDPAVWTYVLASNVAVGDQLEEDFLRPDGVLYDFNVFAPADAAGTWCFDGTIDIAGKQAAQYPGTWTVKGYWNNSVLFTLTFTLSLPGPTCTYSISPTSATNPSGSVTVQVTTGTTCKWTATVDASGAGWLHVTSGASGTGNGQVVLSADANTTSSARTGTATIAGKTFTVTQPAAVSPPPIGRTITLAPSTSSNATGTTVTVTAKVTDQNGAAQAGVAVTFTILSGPNAGASGVCSPSNCNTGSDGQATFTYTGSGGIGQDSITACIAAPGAAVTSLEACCSAPVLSAAAKLVTTVAPGSASPIPQAAKSNMVVVIGAANVDPNCSAGANVSSNGGCLPVTGKAGELGDFTFSGMVPASVSAASLAAFDSAVLNVASSGMSCNTNKLSTQAKTDLVAFVAAGHKLIIYDSECQSSGNTGLDYTWLPYPFTTANPGGLGAQGTLNIVENSTLGSAVQGSASFVDAADLSNNTDAVGDMNVMTTKDAHWCLAMSGTNALKVTGPVHAYAKYPAGTDSGLFIYNGLDLDTLDNLGNANLRKIWVLELQQAFNPSNLPCGVAVVGITISPSTGTSAVGTQYTLTARVIDQTGKAQPNVTVTFTVTGTNANVSGACSPAGCKTDTNGQATFTYTGSQTPGQDSITACFTPAGGITPVCSAPATKTWTSGGGGTICATPVGATWTTPSVVCNYFVQPLTNTGIPAAGTRNGFFQIFTGLTCKWGAISNDTWIVIIAGASGSGSPGAVSYSVAANPTNQVRTGTISITDGKNVVQTHTVIQLPGGPPCTYGLSPLYTTVPATGGGGGTLLSTVSSCFWIAVPNDSWIHVTPSSGYGSQILNFSTDVNSSTSARSGTFGVMENTFTVFQGGAAAPLPPGTPTISSGGIVNAASSRGGPIARGSFFTIYGTGIGPTVPVQATSYPIPDTAGGVVVNLTQGSIVKRAYLHFVSSTQINGIIPSDAPLGDVQMTVIFNGTVGVSTTATLVDTSFGIFSAASGIGPGIIQNWNSQTEVLLNLPTIPAKPAQLAILWGTGLGPIGIPDNNKPPVGDLTAPVVVEVAGIDATVVYHGRAPDFAGVDNIYFYLPAGVAQGCSVPVRVKAGSTWGNTVRMAISGNPGQCTDPASPNSTLPNTGGKIGAVILARADITGQFQAGQPTTSATLDLGMAVFAQIKAGGQLAFSGALNLPPTGSCASNTRGMDFSTLLGGDLLSVDTTVGGQLDAGPKITVTGPKGSVDLNPMGSNAGSYMGLLGGTVPLSGAASMPLFLDGGSSITISGQGGKDVGPLSAQFTMPYLVTWTNRDQINTVDRNTALTVNWTGGDPSQMLLVLGGAQDNKTHLGGGFMCLVPSTQGTFTVPVSILADLPATRPLTGGPDDSLGGLALFSVPTGTIPTFTATGVDNKFVVAGSISLKAVQIQ